MSGPVYHYDAKNPSTTKFPAYFDGANFFYEWARDSVKEIRFDKDGKLLKINDFLESAKFAKPMDMTFGPDGSLYVLEWGSEFGGGNNDSGLYRVDYAQGRRIPLAKAKASATDGPVPLKVDFSSTGSSPTRPRATTTPSSRSPTPRASPATPTSPSPQATPHPR